MAAPLPATIRLPAVEPARAWPRVPRAAWVFAAWAAFMALLDPRVLLPWIAPAGAADVAVRACTGAVLTLGIFRLEARFPLEREPRARWAAIHLCGALVFWVAAVAVIFPVHQRLAPGSTLGWRDALLSSLHWHALLYWFVLGAGLALNYSDRVNERESAAARLRVTAARLEAEFARARLHALRMQMQPHFLFNTLNALSELIHVDAARAADVAEQLSGLLRLTLASSAQEVPLRDEMALLGRYLALQRTRFGDRLDVTVSVEAGLEEVRVPATVLQPLVENALQHGIAPGGGVQRVSITARRDEDALVLEVRDNGPGPQPDGRSPRPGVALANIRARLEHLYGAEAARLELVTAPAGRGAIARVRVPLR
ncbi:MAG TPA: histidine kinase [Longimicrobium sp.]|nr:histidine kinase [Longimicrobium sp.]